MVKSYSDKKILDINFSPLAIYLISLTRREKIMTMILMNNTYFNSVKNKLI